MASAVVCTPLRRAGKDGQLAVIQLLRTPAEVTYLCDMTPNEAGYPPIHVVRSHTVEFDKWYTPDKDTPAQKAAEIYRERALRLGASPEAMEAIGKLCNVTKEQIEMATAKAAAAAPKKTTPAAVKAAPKAAPAKAEENVRPTAVNGKKAPVAVPRDKTKEAKPMEPPKEKASTLFMQLIMEGKLTDDQIFAKVQEKFGLDDKKRSYVGWYRNKLKKDGLNPPGPIGAETKPAAEKKGPPRARKTND